MSIDVRVSTEILFQSIVMLNLRLNEELIMGRIERVVTANGVFIPNKKSCLIRANIERKGSGN